MINICVFASGNGSNLKSIFYDINKNKYNANIKLLYTNNIKSKAVIFAKKNNIDFKIVSILNKKCNNNIISNLEEYNIELIILAGFIKKIPDDIVIKYHNKMLNIHPALLPKYGGKGYYGMKVHNAVIKSGDKETGVTVHFVDKKYDNGPIIAQNRISVLQNDSAETLSKRVLEQEHIIYPMVVRAFCEDRILWKNNKPIIIKRK